MLFLQCRTDIRTFSVEQLQTEILQTFGWQVWEQAVSGTLYRLERTEPALPPISVVVCTRDRPRSLERCLASLTQLDYPSYEVVVVDNCSKDPAVAEIIARSGFRYVRENRPGLDWARNRGFKEARHDIIAYIDDDALAGPGWLQGIARGFADPEVMALTGMVLPAEIETQAQNDFESYGGMSKGFNGFVVRREQLDSQARFWASNWGVGANMAFRRSILEGLGGFDIALDVGTPTSGAGDIEFFYRVVAAGHVLRYEPAAMVRHVHRRDSESLRRQIYNNGRSFAAYLLTIADKEPYRRLEVLWFAIRWWIWPWLIQRLIRSIARRDKWTLRFALIELWGSLSAVQVYHQAQKIALQQTKR
jgi:glycosyltransferase involved in cell wall biosynthesis